MSTKKDFSHLEKFKTQLHATTHDFYDFDPFVKCKERRFVQIRQCIAYVLHSYNNSYSLSEIGYLVGPSKGDIQTFDHATALHAINKIKDQVYIYDDISNLLSEAYHIVGSAMNGSEKRRNKAREIMSRIDDNIKFTTDQQYHWELMKHTINQYI